MIVPRLFPAAAGTILIFLLLLVNGAICQERERPGTLGENTYDFAHAEATGDWDIEWNGIPDSSFRSGGIITPINKWFKFACTPEAIKNNRNYFCDEKGRIRCMPGWTQEMKMCMIPDCNINNQTCINGNCSRPYICDCNIGWTGQFCDKCVKLPGCVNGYCNNSFECRCLDGWEGMNCDKAVCDGCVHGVCHMPGMCACHPGWTGPNCTDCVKRSACEYGRCVNRPFECQCYSGYKGITCEIPECKIGCNTTGGYCKHPEVCICKSGWEGETCDQCVRKFGCQNGVCTNPWECNCLPGWTGELCDATGDTDGNWGTWSQWTDCKQEPGKKKCFRARLRFCDSPKPGGDGKYCSLDGSSCEDYEKCSCGDSSTPTDGFWGTWGAWSVCSASCAGGIRTRTRACDNPSPANGGSACVGNAQQQGQCNAQACPPPVIDGMWSTWSAWGKCDAKCTYQTGQRVRRRFCNNPPPSSGGQDCAGSLNEVNRRQNETCTGDTPPQQTDPSDYCFNIQG